MPWSSKYVYTAHRPSFARGCSSSGRAPPSAAAAAPSANAATTARLPSTATRACAETFERAREPVTGRPPPGTPAAVSCGSRGASGGCRGQRGWRAGRIRAGRIYSLVQLGAFVGCVGVTVARAWRKGPRGRDGGGDARVPRRARGRCHISVPCRAVEAMPRNRTLRQVDDSELRYDKLYLRVFPFLAGLDRSQPGAQPGDFGRLERIRLQVEKRRCV